LRKRRHDPSAWRLLVAWKHIAVIYKRADFIRSRASVGQFSQPLARCELAFFVYPFDVGRAPTSMDFGAPRTQFEFKRAKRCALFGQRALIHQFVEWITYRN
jgi:hypothetical protein